MQRRPSRPFNRLSLALLALLIGLGLGFPSRQAEAQAAPPAKTETSSAPSVDELQKLVGTLQNDKDRAQLIDQLKALIAAQKGVEKKSEPASFTFLDSLAQQFDTIGSEILNTAGIASAAPWLIYWLEEQVNSPEARSLWLTILTQLVIIFGVAAIAGIGAAYGLRKFQDRFAPRPGAGILLRALFFVLRAFLEALPVLIFAGVATLVLAMIHPGQPAQPVAAIIIDGILYAQLLLAVLRVSLLSATSQFLRLSEESRHYLYIWARRFIFWAIYADAAAQAAWWLGIPGSIYALMLRGITLVLAVLAIVFVLQNRASVADAIRGHKGAGNFVVLRNSFADTWHILAIVYVIGSFGSFVLNIQGGFVFVLRATIVSVIVLLLAGLSVRFAQRLSRRGLALHPDLKTRFPGLEARSNRYLPALIIIASVLVYAAAALILLQAWGIDAFAWLESAIVRNVADSVISIVIVLVAAVVLWELFNAGIERALGVGDDTRRAQLSARARTLLPLLRTVTMIALILVAGFIVLSQIGVNIAPLLAGASIVGIAIGFGSQKLVQDIITGLFLLLETAMQVGDIVTVSGLNGTVENLSIRTVRLRAGDGSVHIIPFSSVTSVTNFNRGIGNAAVTVNVAFGEDIERVSQTLREIAAALRRDAKFKSLILTDLDLWGVDRVDGAMVTLVGQIMCTDTGRWPVQREFNRRMKQRFEELDITIAMPTQSVMLHPLAEAHAQGDEPPAEPTKPSSPRSQENLARAETPPHPSLSPKLGA